MNNASGNTEATIRALLQAQMAKQAPGINPPGGPGQEGAGPMDSIPGQQQTAPGEAPMESMEGQPESMEPPGQPEPPPINEAAMMASQGPKQPTPIEDYIQRSRAVMPQRGPMNDLDGPGSPGAAGRAVMGAIPVPGVGPQTAPAAAEGRFSNDMSTMDQNIADNQGQNAGHMAALGASPQQAQMMSQLQQPPMTKEKAALIKVLMGQGLGME